MNERVKGYVSIANKAGYLIVGADNLKGYHKKLFLVLADETGGKNLLKVAQYLKQNLNIELFVLKNLESYTGIEGCKIVGIKNKGISDEIIKLLRSQQIW